MKISSKGEYGLRALVDLAIHRDTGPNKIKSIAERQDIPKKYLEQVLLDLKRGGLVASSRGKNGGYYLARDPEEITVLDVMEILEEKITMTDSGRERPSYLESFWAEQSRQLRGQLEVPISELVRRKEQAEGEMMYHI